MFMTYFIHNFPTNMFGCYCGHHQCDIITRMQRYKCSLICGHHSITIKNYYKLRYNYISNIKRDYKWVMIKILGVKLFSLCRVMLHAVMW